MYQENLVHPDYQRRANHMQRVVANPQHEAQRGASPPFAYSGSYALEVSYVSQEAEKSNRMMQTQGASSYQDAYNNNARVESGQRVEHINDLAHGRPIDFERLMKSYRSILTHLAMPTSGSSSSSGDEFQSLDQAAIEGLRILDPFQAERISRRGTAEGGGSSEGASGEREGSTEGVHVTEPEKQKKKEGRPAEQKCRSCETTATPEWRRGPLGPRTLCNACGLVWAKMVKKRHLEGGGNGGDMSARMPTSSNGDGAQDS